MPPPPRDGFDHPYDTPISASLRFAVELIAWVAGPWALTTVSPWLGVVGLVVLIGLPSVFSTPNDKRHIVVATPGPVRVVIELLLYAVALVAPWLVWSSVGAGVASGIVLASLVAGYPRMRWLLRGAPPRG